VLGTETVHTTAYHPKTNGKVEMCNLTMATQLRHYLNKKPVAGTTYSPDGPSPITAERIGRQAVLVELFIPRRVPSLSVRNLPPGILLKNRGTGKSVSPLEPNDVFMAQLRQELLATVEAMQKTQ